MAQEDRGDGQDQKKTTARKSRLSMQVIPRSRR
jgi:hypothetical protein